MVYVGSLVLIILSPTPTNRNMNLLTSVAGCSLLSLKDEDSARFQSRTLCRQDKLTVGFVAGLVS